MPHSWLAVQIQTAFAIPATQLGGDHREDRILTARDSHGDV